MVLSLVVLASGRGSNFLAILNAIKSKKCDATVLALICDNANAPVLKIAKEYSIPSCLINRKDFLSISEFENSIYEKLLHYSADLVVLAGYMRVIRSSKILDNFKIINIHPSLLPKYSGLDAQKQAFDAKEKVSGLTIHLVDSTLDGGKILYQKKVDISDCKSANEVSQKILHYEHLAYPSVIQKIASKEIKL
jgi:phosphoribosylglycinamide formyltransferase-1